MLNEDFPNELLLFLKLFADVPSTDGIQKVDPMVAVWKSDELVAKRVTVGAVEFTSDEVIYFLEEGGGKPTVNIDMGQRLYAVLAEWAIWTVCLNAHFVAHIAASRDSVEQLIVELDKFKIVREAKEKVREDRWPISILVTSIRPPKFKWWQGA